MRKVEVPPAHSQALVYQVVDVLPILRKGTVFLKYCKNWMGISPHFRVFKLDASKSCVTYNGPKGKIGSVRLRGATIVCGACNKTKYAPSAFSSLCFSILEQDGKTSLDLCAKDTLELYCWVNGLKKLLEGGSDVSEISRLHVRVPVLEHDTSQLAFIDAQSGGSLDRMQYSFVASDDPSNVKLKLLIREKVIEETVHVVDVPATLTDAFTWLQMGSQVLKVSQKGTPSWRRLFVAVDTMCVGWLSKKKAKIKNSENMISLKNVDEIILGAVTEPFQKAVQKGFRAIPASVAHVAFSLMYRMDGKRCVLPIVCADQTHFEIWTEGLTHMIERARNGVQLTKPVTVKIPVTDAIENEKTMAKIKKYYGHA